MCDVWLCCTQVQNENLVNFGQVFHLYLCCTRERGGLYGCLCTVLAWEVGIMDKPKIEECIKPVYRNGKVISHGVDFVEYATKLEEYIKWLEGVKA